MTFGDEHGWPVAIKAAFGGGGRGMKVVDSPTRPSGRSSRPSERPTPTSAATSATSSATSAKPRHIEIQVLCDSHGNGIYLGQRDCSAQRRHQKLIEEAPAPDLSAEIAKAMGEAAVKVALGCDYTNAGTVEFLYEDGEFFYLEMNTRLQVEHPVTELVTGLDLVAQQLPSPPEAELP